jgi:hypothetical protein
VQSKDVLFLNSSRSSVVTTVSLRSSNIQSAALEVALSSLDALSMSSFSSSHFKRSGSREKESVLLEMKSDKTQKNVTVC